VTKDVGVRLYESQKEQEYPFESENLGGVSLPSSNPPPGFEIWKKGLIKLFPRELEKLRATMVEKRKAANADNAKAQWALKIAAIEELLLGPPVQDEPKPKPVRQAPPVQISEEQREKELLGMIKVKMEQSPEFLTKQNFALLVKHQVKIPDAIRERFS